LYRVSSDYFVYTNGGYASLCLAAFFLDLRRNVSIIQGITLHSYRCARAEYSLLIKHVKSVKYEASG
jgi:hypothetical protein